MNIYNELEKLRKTCMLHTLIGGGFTVAGFIAGATALGFLGMVFVVIGLLYLILVAGKKQRAYKKFYKENVVRQVLEEYLDDVHFAPNMGIDQQLIRDTEMRTMGNRYHSNDYIKASYKGTQPRGSVSKAEYIVQLQSAMQQAIDEQNFELAAAIRDEINKIQEEGGNR